MMNTGNWILTDDVFMKPSYRISPFSTSSIANNGSMSDGSGCDLFFDKKHPGYHPQYLLKARHGITHALLEIGLSAADCVTVLTTTDNLYVSGCVTRAIEEVCRWDRVLSSQTKAIVVVHEFGTVYPQMQKLHQLGIPVIEDFAHSFNSSSDWAGQGDYLIYSFPKYFPIQYGGMLLSKEKLKQKHAIAPEHEAYIKKVISGHVDYVNEYAEKRTQNYNYLLSEFAKLSCQPRYIFNAQETSSVFMFCPPANINLVELKNFMQGHGIECSVFYGEQAFFIPAHHRLQRIDLDYFVFVYQTFIRQGA